MLEEKHIAWFSAGVSSAVTIKLSADKLDSIIYIHIDDQHPDTIRFVNDCEKWFNKEIIRIQSPYKSVENAILNAGGKGYINGVAGAACTRFLKKRVRKEWELEQGNIRFTYYWGFDCNEVLRANRIKETMPEQNHIFPLIENNFSKEKAHTILKASGIKRPMMYDLGYLNNNCVGCVKGGMGYWNKIRIDFPGIFTKRAELERRVGATCIKGVFLDELDPNRGRKQEPICDDCGIFCESLLID